MRIAFKLYSTSHCHLCEQAEELINSIQNEYDVSFTIIDIADDISLQAIYERRIPVLKRLDNNEEIGWQFAIDDIKKIIME